MPPLFSETRSWTLLSPKSLKTLLQPARCELPSISETRSWPRRRRQPPKPKASQSNWRARWGGDLRRRLSSSRSTRLARCYPEACPSHSCPEPVGSRRAIPGRQARGCRRRKAATLGGCEGQPKPARHGRSVHGHRASHGMPKGRDAGARYLCGFVRGDEGVRFCCRCSAAERSKRCDRRAAVTTSVVL